MILKKFCLGEQEGSEPGPSEDAGSLSAESFVNVAGGEGNGKKKGKKKKAAKGEVKL